MLMANSAYFQLLQHTNKCAKIKMPEKISSLCVEDLITINI